MATLQQLLHLLELCLQLDDQKRRTAFDLVPQVGLVSAIQIAQLAGWRSSLERNNTDFLHLHSEINHGHLQPENDSKQLWRIN